MKTVYNSLTFYDSVDKQDYNRTKAQIPVFSARHYLPPFLIDLDTDSVSTADAVTVELIDKDGNAYNDYITGITGWSNITMSGFTSSGLNITDAFSYNTEYARTNFFTVIAGDTVTLTGTYAVTQYSGTLTMDVIGAGAAVVQTLVLTPGVNTITHTFTADVSSAYIVITASGSPPTGFGFTLTSVSTSFARHNINRYFPTLPEVIISGTLGNYLQYKGDTLNYLLPLGLYYVRVSVAGYVYYSDYIMVDNIYPNMISSWINTSYETLVSARTIITSLINTSGDGFAKSDQFTVKKGETIRVIFYCNYNSGTRPTVILCDPSLNNQDYDSMATGLNDISLTAQHTGAAVIALYNNATNVNIALTEVLVLCTYGPKFCKLRFTDTNNLGNLLYEDSFTQIHLLEAGLNNPTHENTIVGEEKDGVFIPEKIVSKQLNTLIAYVSRAVYNALIRLPQHDTITITDETGNVYSPAAGNVTIEQPEWSYYDTCKMTIRFGDGDNTAYTWTK